MANSTLNSNDWGLYFTSSTYRECLVIFIILFYGLKIQLQKVSHQRHINLIKEFKESGAHVGHLTRLVYLHEGL